MMLDSREAWLYKFAKERIFQVQLPRTRCGQGWDGGVATKLGALLRSPFAAVSNGIDSMRMTALGAWAASELGMQGAASIEILWAHGSPSIEVSADFDGEGVFTARSEDESRRDKAVMRAVSKIIDDRVEAFNYARLKPRGDEPWWHVLGVSPEASANEIKSAFRQQAFKAHPDHGGNDAAMARLVRAKADADLSTVH